MKLRLYPLLLLAVFLAPGARGFAQGAPAFPATLEKELAARATNYTEVTLDKSMLTFASKFMDGKDADDAKVKGLIEKLDGIYVRTYTFDKDGQYSTEDVEAIRRQFPTPLWSPMVRERTKKGSGKDSGDTDIFVKLVNGDIHGMFILSAEAKELTFVFISGPIRPEDINELGGNFGIPKVHGEDGGAKLKGGSK